MDKLAREDWRFQVNVNDAQVDIVKPDPDRRGCWIGPLATIPLGVTDMNDDGDEICLLDGDDGRNLYAIAAIPQFARLLVWLEERMAALESVHFDVAHDYGRFMRELSNRTHWLKDLIDKRDKTIVNGTHCLMTFDKAVEPKDRAR